jgi:hypothetical protein
LRKILFSFLSLILSLLFLKTQAQTNNRIKIKRCATVEYYKELFKLNPQLKQKFDANQSQLKTASSNQINGIYNLQDIDDTIPIVIHVVATSAIQAQVTDAILQSQIDILNQDFAGLNADSVRIPASFKPLFGKSKLFFMLARQNEYGEPTTGVVRTESTTTFTAFDSDNAKKNITGGSNAWDPSKYLNMWIVSFANSGILGISVFPGDPRPSKLHGFVSDYRAFGKDGAYLFSEFNKGRTTTHEIGHFFNLKHIWGDDNGACTGNDFESVFAAQDDTPNQGDATNGNPDPDGTGVVVIDTCSPNAPGIMYQNFMDYTDDVAMVMFTKGQHAKMQSAIALSPDRSPLLSSVTYLAPPVFLRDARIRKIINPSPSSAQCANFTPSLFLRNSGSEPLTSVQINYSLNNAAPVIFSWIGLLNPYSETIISIPQIAGVLGQNKLVIYTSNPNGSADQNLMNDTVKVDFEISPVVPLNTRREENFSSAAFPPPDWRVVNPDGDMTWERNASIGKQAPGSAWFNDWNNETYFLYDDLVMPNYSYSNADSSFLTFQLATAIYSDPAGNIPIDTLTILLSKDCGSTFTTVYKKWGEALQTINNRPEGEFFPSQHEWRKDSVNLGQWLGANEEKFQVFFRFNGNYENNIFIDDVVLYTKAVPQTLKEKGYLVLPTVTRNKFAVWHYQPPVSLKSLSVVNTTGQVVWQRNYSKNAYTFIDVNLTGHAAGIYFVTMIYEDGRRVSERIIKQ